MLSSSNAVMATANAVLRFLIVANLLGFLLLASVFVGTFALEGTLLKTLAEQGRDPGVELLDVRGAIVLALLMIPLGHLIFTRLRTIVGTVRAGDPFLQANGRRLQLIAWCLLGIQLLQLVYGAAMLSLVPRIRDVPGWDLSVTGWLSVLLLFVLARVFEHGARMRDDLEGMV